MDAIQVREIFVHPVKGLTAERRQRVQLAKDFGIVGDRAFALMFVDAGDPQPQTPWLPKKHFAVQNDWGKLAALECRYDSDRHILEVCQNGEVAICESVNTTSGRDRLSQFFSQYLQTLTPSPAARHPQATTVQLVGTSTGETRYPDRDKGQISLVSQATLDNIASQMEVPKVDARRFRPNVVVEGIDAWEEFDWVGRHLQLGTVTVEVTARISRCLNIEVNPQTGDRDLPLLKGLSEHFGHVHTGVIARVLEEGWVETGDRLQLDAVVSPQFQPQK